MKPHILGLTSRFVLAIAAGVIAIAAVMGLLGFRESKDALLECTQEQLYYLAASQASKLSKGLTEVSRPAADLATTWENDPPDGPDPVYKVLRGLMEETKGVFGMAAAFAPGVLPGSGERACPYVWRSPKGIKKVDLAQNYGNYLLTDWYQVPALTGRKIWSEPYFDEGGGDIIMTTFSAPMLVGGQVRGVITADVALDKLGQEVARMAVGREGWAFLITGRGTFLAAPKQEWVMRESLFSLAEGLDRPELRALGRRMVHGGAGVEPIKSWLDGRKVWVAFSPVKGMGWSFGAVIPEAEILDPVWALAKKQALIAAAGLVVLIIAVWMLVTGLTKPLKRLAAGASRLAEGDLHTRVEDVRPGDEVGELAQSFNGMVEDLNRYVEELTSTTAAKERIESELDMARQIQQSILPRTYPAFPQAPQFDLFATTTPAREVGGDFYDFFMLDENRLGLVVGDVSGKGIPAALFMTVARTLVKNAASHYPEPVRVLQEVNAQILPDNEMCMFVTLFYGVYDLSTGKLAWANAGHPPPLIRHVDGRVEMLPKSKGMAVGVFEPMPLEAMEVQLEVGDTILVFTDGLDEAINQAEEMFGIERAQQWLAGIEPKPAPELIKDLVEFQREFTGDVEQFDDLTLLIFHRRQ